MDLQNQLTKKALNNEADESAKGQCKAKDTRYTAAGTVAQFDLFNTNEIGKPKQMSTIIAFTIHFQV